MRKFWILSICLSFLSLQLNAQGGMTLYNMPYIPQASYQNPANTPLCNFYLSLPIISGASFGYNNDFFTLEEVEIDLKARWDKQYGDSLLSSIADVALLSNRLAIRGNVDLFGFGLRAQKHYISFYIREVIQSDLLFPDEMFRFIRDYEKEGVVYQTTNDSPKMVGYIMSGGKIGLTQYRPFTLQYAYDVMPNLTVGGNVSYISGILTADATMDTFFTQIKPQDPNDYEVIGRINVTTAGYSNADSSDLANIFINPQNSGWSFGLGGKLTTMNKRLDLSLSAVNIGQINWKRKVGQTAFTDASFENSDSLGQIFDTLFRVEEKPGLIFKQKLNPEFFLGANYYLSQNMSVGALFRVQPIYQTLYSSVTLAFNARVGKWLGFSTGYSYTGRAHNIPFGLSLNPGPIQLYVISDNLLGFLVPASARQIHLQAGLNLTFGKTSRPWDELPTVPERTDALIDQYKPGYKDPVTEPADSEPADPEPLGVEEPGLPPRDTIYPPDGGEEPLYKEDEPDVTSYMVTNPIYLYRGPSSNTTVLDTIMPNTVMNVLQKRLPDWWYVEYGENSGWIQPRSIRPSYELPSSVQEESDIPDPVIQFSPLDYIMLENTPMREMPSETSKETHSMKKWDEVLVLEKTNSSWWKIRHGKFEGYVKSAMLNPRPDNYVRPEVVEEAPPKPPVVAPKPAPSGSSLGVFVVNESTSLRSGPTHESNSLVRVRSGAKVNLLEKTNQFWWKVETNGQTGYIKAANLSSPEN